MSLVELGRYGRNEAHIIVGRLESEGIPAIAFDGGMSILEGELVVDSGPCDGRRGGSRRGSGDFGGVSSCVRR